MTRSHGHGLSMTLYTNTTLTGFLLESFFPVDLFTKCDFIFQIYEFPAFSNRIDSNGILRFCFHDFFLYTVIISLINSWISRWNLRRPWRKTSRSPYFGKSSSHGTIFSNLVKDKDKKTKTTIGWNFSGWRRRPQFIQSLSNSCKYFHKSHPA